MRASSVGALSAAIATSIRLISIGVLPILAVSSARLAAKSRAAWSARSASVSLGPFALLARSVLSPRISSALAASRALAAAMLFSRQRAEKASIMLIASPKAAANSSRTWAPMRAVEPAKLFSIRGRATLSMRVIVARPTRSSTGFTHSASQLSAAIALLARYSIPLIARLAAPTAASPITPGSAAQVTRIALNPPTQPA